MPANGAVTTVTMPIHGQGLQYTFAANAGDYRALVISETSSSIRSAAVSIVAPSGETLASGTLGTTASSGPNNTTLYSGRMLLNAGPMPTTGNYAVVIRPTTSEPNSAGSTLSLTFSEPVQGPVVMGTPQTVTIPSIGQGLLRTFTGTTGQHVSVRVAEAASGISSVGVKLLAPGGTVLKSGAFDGSSCAGCTTYSGTVTLTSGLLPSNGTYGVLVQQTTLNGAGTGELTVEVTDQQAGTGGTSNIATTTPGQYGTSSFTAVAGQSFGIALSSVALAPSASAAYSIYVWRPDGVALEAVNCSGSAPGCELPLRNVPLSGTYQVEVRPDSTATISGVLTISPALTGELTIDTPFATALSGIGQTAHLSFTTTSTQTVAVGMDSISTMPADTTMTMVIHGVTTGLRGSVSSKTGIAINLPNLPPDNYFVWITPQYPVTSTMQVTVRSAVGGTAPVNGAGTSFSTHSRGQQGRFTFSATAGDSVSVALTNVTLAPTANAGYNLRVYAPSGNSYLAPCNGAQLAGCELAMRNVPASGVYLVLIEPDPTVTISGTLTVSPALTGTLNADTPFAANLGAVGQAAYLSFTAATGQSFSLNIAALSTTPADTWVSVEVFNSAGTRVGNPITTQTGATLNLPNLPPGNYFAWITPQLPATSTMQVTLKSTVMAPVNGAATPFSTSWIGQQGHLTFSATAGESVSVALTNVTLAPTANAGYNLRVYAPSGISYLATCNGAQPAGCELAMRNLPATGVYLILIEPTATVTISGTLTVSPAVTETLMADTPLALNLNVVGQPAHLRFTATAGQHFSLNIGPLSTTPANTMVTVEVFNSAGTPTVFSQSTSTAATIALHNLDADTYFVWIRPERPMTGAMQVLLRTTPVVPTNGAATSVSAVTPGQYTQFNFYAEAGQSVTAALSNVVVTPLPTNNTTTYMMYVVRPDTQSMGPVHCSSSASGSPGCEYPIRVLPQSGLYTVQIVPAHASTTVSGVLTVSMALTATLVPDVPLTADLAAMGQAGHLRYTATAGQYFSLNIGPLSTVPPDSTVSVEVFNSAGTLMVFPRSTNIGATIALHNLPADTYFVWIRPELPMTGTMQVLLRTTPVVPTNGAATNFSVVTPGQYTQFNFYAEAGQSVTAALSNVVVTPLPTNDTTTYRMYVVRPNNEILGVVNCSSSASGSPGCEYPIPVLPQSGVYTVQIVPANTSTTVSGVLTVSMALTGALVPVTSSSSTAAITLNAADLAAGTYTAWIAPQSSAASSMTVSTDGAEDDGRK